MGPRGEPGRLRKHLVDLVTITAGVLIALSLEGARQWIGDRALVREAERTLILEIQENRDEIERMLASDEQHQEALEQAQRFADELLEDGTTEVTELDLGFALAELSSASWTTAERTGAIANMDYERVRQLSRVYEAQDLFVEQQRRNLEQLSAALAILAAGSDPTQVAPADLRVFRSEVMGLRAALFLQRELAEGVQALYEEVLSAAGLTVEETTTP